MNQSTDYAYAAGYIDGDGCFQLSPPWGSHCVIVSTRIESINWFMLHFDGVIRCLKPKTKNRQNSFHFRFSEKGTYTLPEIAKYLIEKRQEFEVFNKFRNSVGKDAKLIYLEEMKFLKNKSNLIDYCIKKEIESFRNTIEPTLEDFAYLAGWIDAECSLDISRTMHKKGKNPCYRIQLQCNNSKAPFFSWASQRFGGQFHFLDKSHIPNCRNQMLWRLSCKQLYPILEGIYPFLQTKKKNCELMLEFHKLTPNRKGCPSPNSPHFESFYKPILEAKESIYLKVRHHNNHH